ncbi:MAG: shikimate kinase [Desulfobacterales bacterium]|nr:shikimate kinase [Desulfobacterales bacterium]
MKPTQPGKPIQPAPNLYLIGFRCTGKTSVGKTLAQILGRPFTDADRALEEHACATVARIVARDGWSVFRKMEKEVLARLAGMDGQIVATGGGVVIDLQNRAVLKQSGTTVWLRASAETILSRMGADAQTGSLRPALTDKGLEEEVRDTLARRKPLYAEAADLTVDTDGKTIETVCNLVLAELRNVE